MRGQVHSLGHERQGEKDAHRHSYRRYLLLSNHPQSPPITLEVIHLSLSLSIYIYPPVIILTTLGVEKQSKRKLVNKYSILRNEVSKGTNNPNNPDNLDSPY